MACFYRCSAFLAFLATICNAYLIRLHRDMGSLQVLNGSLLWLLSSYFCRTVMYQLHYIVTTQVMIYGYSHGFVNIIVCIRLRDLAGRLFSTWIQVPVSWMPTCWHRNSHYKEKTVSQVSSLCDADPCAWKEGFLYKNFPYQCMMTSGWKLAND